jgi:hypothetical protein
MLPATSIQICRQSFHTPQFGTAYRGIPADSGIHSRQLDWQRNGAHQIDGEFVWRFLLIDVNGSTLSIDAGQFAIGDQSLANIRIQVSKHGDIVPESQSLRTKNRNDRNKVR